MPREVWMQVGLKHWKWLIKLMKERSVDVPVDLD